MNVKLVSRRSREFRDVLREVLQVSRLGSGRVLAVRALLSAEDSLLAVAFWKNGRVAGASSFRPGKTFLKRINTGALIRRRGVGTALLKFIAKSFPNLPQVSKNTREGSALARSVGARYAGRIGTLSKYKLSKARVRKLAQEDRPS